MHSVKLAAALLTPVVISTGCSNTPSPPFANMEVIETQFICGANLIETSFTGDALDLVMDDTAYALQLAPAASGARYVGQLAGQPVEFWNKGRLATLTVDDTIYPRCLQRDANNPLYQAQGQEPGWQFTQAGDTGLLITNYGAQEFYFPELQSRQGTISGHIGDDRLEMSIKSEICHDSMSGLPHPDQVELHINANTLSGCGGDPQQLLRNTHWQVDLIDEQALPDDTEISITFLEDGAVAGLAACNRFRGQYEIREHGVVFTPLATTMMACEEPVMHLEQTFLSQLQNNMGHTFLADGRLKLFDPAGNQIIARRAEDSETPLKSN